MADESRPLPQYLEAERAVLGGILIDNTALDRCIEVGLTAEHFFLNQHQTVFNAMLFIWEDRTPIDLITLTQLLDGSGKLAAAGGTSYILQLMDGVPRASNVAFYAKIIQDKAALRSLIHLTEAVQQQAFDSDNVDEVLDSARAAINKLSERAVKRGPVKLKDLIGESYAQIEKTFSEGRRITGLSTGYLNLDNQLAGLQPSELIVLAARPSVGKSALALNIVENIMLGEAKHPILFFSLEMSKASLLMRLISSHGRVDGHKFRTGHLSQDDMSQIGQALGRLTECELWIDDSSSISVREMHARGARIKRDHGLALIVVDYIQLIVPTGGRSRQEQIGEISHALKSMGKDLEVPIIALSQLTRAPEREERRPLLSDLRESGAIEQDADVVLFIHRPNFHKVDISPEERAKAEIIIAKQRNGPIGNIDFIFIDRHTRFEQAAPDMFWED